MTNKHIALILLEGDTEEEFFKLLSSKYLEGIPKKFRNMEGNFNINDKIIDKVMAFSGMNRNKTFDVYVCVDREKEGSPIYNEKYVSKKISSIDNCLEIHDVIAELMLESLFFIDINGIYKFLRTPKKSRNLDKYKNFRKLTHRDLTRLFKQYKKIYTKGHKCQSFVQSLNIETIISTAPEIEYFISTMKSRHKEMNC